MSESDYSYITKLTREALSNPGAVVKRRTGAVACNPQKGISYMIHRFDVTWISDGNEVIKSISVNSKEIKRLKAGKHEEAVAYISQKLSK